MQVKLGSLLDNWITIVTSVQAGIQSEVSTLRTEQFVVISAPAEEAAFVSADLVTFTGSITPVSIRFSNVSVLTLKPTDWFSSVASELIMMSLDNAALFKICFMGA